MVSINTELLADDPSCLKMFCSGVYTEKQEDRKDLSHAVHVDNCLLVSEMNECIKEPPAYTHRDYR